MRLTTRRPPAAMRPPSPAGRVIAIASGKGGVGKTWLAVTLSRALVLQGRRVLLLDGDLGLANVDIQLGLMPEQDLTELVSGRLDLADCAIPFAPGGFSVLAGRSGSPALAALDPGSLDRLLGMVAGAPAYDSVVVDLGAGLDWCNRRMAAWADTLLVIATDEPTSLTDAYTVLKLYASDRTAGDVRIVVNLAGSEASGQRTFTTLARASATFLGTQPVLAGIIRRDDHVREAIRRQTLLQVRYPNTAAAQDVEKVAASLLG